MNENNTQQEFVDEGMDIRDLLNILLNRKFTILIVFVLAVLLGIAYLYFANRVYESSTLLRIREEKSASMSKDMLEQALQGGPMADVDTEIGILQSFGIAEAALNQVPFNVRYFERSGFKWTETNYAKAPLFINSYKIPDSRYYGKKFYVIPLKNGRFELKVKKSLMAKIGLEEDVSYDGKHRFGEQISAPGFTLTINKRKESKITKPLFFTINNKRAIVENKILPNLKVLQKGKKASLVTVSYQDNIPERAQLIANAVSDAYILQTIDTKSEQASKKLSFVEEQLRIVRKKLEESSQKVEEFKKTNNVMDISSETQAMIDRISTFDQQLAQIEIEENQAKRLYDLLKQDNFSALSLSPMQLSDQVIQGMLLSLSEAERKKKSLLVEFTENHPEVIQQTVQIKKLKRQIRSNIASYLQGLTERKNSIKQIIDKNEASYKGLPGVEKDYVDMMRSLTVNEKIYSFLLEKQFEASIMKASTVSGSAIVDPALLPLKPVKPKPRIVLIASAFLGLFLGILLALLLDMFDTSIKSIDDITRETSIPEVGAVPFYSEVGYAGKVIRDNPKSSFAEAFRMIRTNLQFMAAYSERKVIMITSTIMGEGKTTIALNLATLFAMAGKKCVLLNMDLRRPALHKFFDVDNEEGLSNYLVGQVDLKKVVYKTEMENLDIVFSGTLPPNPSELLMSEKLKSAITELKEKYDYVILDTPPIGLVSDGLILAEHSDIVLLILRMNYSSKSFASSFENWARSHNIQNTGIITNAITPKKYYYGYSRYGYNYNYGYGYSYGNDSGKRSRWKRWLGRK